MRVNDITVLPSFTVVKIVVNNFDNGFVEHFAEPAMKRCLYGSLCNFGIQYKEGKSASSSRVLIPKDDRTERWFFRISSFVKLVRW